ncbi:MAG: hypothetical protein HGA24_09245, partial [Candidatus Aminicenantes bacterium]|nr:hypothetical protein [Candidatus Aminicenantes bacterium]
LYAAELSPDNPMVLSNLGVAELGKGNDKEAEALFLRAVARAPRHPEANYALGRMAGRRGDDQAAERYLSASLDGAYTDRAARALRSLERSSKTRTGRRAAPAGPPPPVPAQAAKAGKDLRLVLPVIEAGSLPDFVAAEKAFRATERVAWAIQAPTVLEMKEFSDPRVLKSSKASSGSTGTTLRLGDGKARRAREQLNRWYALWMDTLKEFGDYHTDFIKRMAVIGAEQARLYREERQKCYALVGRAREACMEEAERRACGRYFEAYEPLLDEYRARYTEFRPRWEDAARGYLQYTFYTASLMSDPIEAKALVTHARGTVATSFRLICSNLAGMCNVFRPPTDRCFEMPPPPPPTGELRVEDFVVPCSFPGFRLAFGPVSFGVDCTSVTIGGELGPVVGELEWNFVEKQGTFFIGLSESMDWGEDLSVELSGRIGLSFSFDEDEITDIALEAEANLGASLDLWLKTVDLGEGRAAGRIGLNSPATFE